MRLSTAIAILFTFVLLNTACSRFSTQSNGSTDAGPSSGTTELEGTWKSVGCKTSTASGDYQTMIYSVSGSKFQQTVVVYGSNSTCSVPQFTFYSAGEFVLEETQITTPADAKSMDSLATTIMLTPNSQGMADALNTATYCGVSNWTNGMAVSLIGKTCDTLSYPASGYQDYNIYRVVGTILSFGDTSGSMDGSSPAKRPTGFDLFTLAKE